MSSEIKADKWSPASGTAGTIGDNGDTFTVPSGVTLDVASGATLDATGATVTGISGGLVYVGGLVSTSASAYYQVDNVFTSTYSRYLVTFRVIPVTTGAGIDLQFRTSAPATLSANEYTYSLNGFQSDNSSTFRDATANTTVQLTHGVNNDTGRGGMTGMMYVSEPDSGTRCVINANYMYLNDSAALRTMIGSISYKATGDAIAGFQFYGTGGTANDNIARGSIRVYGIVDS
tara:strand:+ start:210 stop:905 length:696 start_codon:yes stop_codon:yes gene_type:complete